MPPRNMNPLPGKMPNGQDKEDYTRKCHKLIESEYKNLLRTALYQTSGDPIWARDLLHDTFLILLEGYHNVDFNKSPVQYVRILIRHVKGRHKQIKQKDFNRTSIVAYDPQSYVIKRHVEEEDKQTEIDYLLEHFQEMQSLLKSKHLEVLECYLDEMSLGEIAKRFHISTQRVGQILLEVKKQLRKKGLVLLQDGPSNDQVSSRGYA